MNLRTISLAADMADRLNLGSVGSVAPIDRFTIGHGMIGFLTGLTSMPWYWTLGISVAWEIIENPIKRAAPMIFPVGKPDTVANAGLDVAAWMAGWALARALPAGPVPAIWRKNDRMKP